MAATTNAQLVLWKLNIPCRRSPEVITCRPSPALAVRNQQARPATTAADIDAGIRSQVIAALPSHPIPEVVTAPLRRLVSDAPSTIAPSLCVAACVLAGGDPSLAADAACAMHLIHAAAHAHRTLPALLGGGSCPPAIALLSGDSLHPLAYEVAVRSASRDPLLAVRVLAEITAAAEGVAAAEWMDCFAGGHPPTMESTEWRLAECGAACGAIIAGAGEETVEKLRAFGRYGGMMYAATVSGGGTAGEEFKEMALGEIGFGFDEAKREGAEELIHDWFEMGKRGVRRT